MKKGQNSGKAKRTYVKPKLRVIDLAADEVLAVGCKLAVGGPSKPAGITCIANGCSTPGS